MHRSRLEPPTDLQERPMSNEAALGSRRLRRMQSVIRALGSVPLRTIALASLIGVTACTGTGKNAGDATVAGTVEVCSSCHGLEGRSVSPTFPRLAGQQQEYLVNQLKAFRDHTRADPHAHT